MSDSSIQDLIALRTTRQVRAYESLSVENVMSYMSEDVDFSDKGMDLLSLSHTKVRSLFEASFASFDSLTITYSNATGTSPDFNVWEMEVRAVAGVDAPVIQPEARKGDEVVLKGVCLLWWAWDGDEEEWRGTLDEKGLQGWKVMREVDYFLVDGGG